MWKRKKKKSSEEVEGEALTAEEGHEDTKEVEVASPSDEATSSSIAQEVKETDEETTVQEEDKQPDEAMKEISVEDEPTSGVFIFGNKIEGGFKKFISTLFSIFFLPPTILFALLILTSVVLLVFPLVAIVLPIILILFCILVVSLPVLIPFFTIVSLITDKGKVCFGFRNKKFAIKVLGITFPRHADR